MGYLLAGISHKRQKRGMARATGRDQSRRNGRREGFHLWLYTGSRLESWCAVYAEDFESSYIAASRVLRSSRWAEVVALYLPLPIFSYDASAMR